MTPGPSGVRIGGALESANGKNKGDVEVDIAPILSSIKDKVLDARHIELLKHAYELQNQNIEQLKSNNEALREKALLLEEKAALLNRENEALKTTINTLESRLAAQPKAEELCEDEKKILVYLAKCGQNRPTSQVIAAHVGVSQPRTECYLGRLFESDYLDHSLPFGRRPIGYSIRQKGRDYLLHQNLVR